MWLHTTLEGLWPQYMILEVSWDGLLDIFFWSPTISWSWLLVRVWCDPHWWKRWSWSKFASHYAWGTDGVCECNMDVKSTWIPTWHWMDHVSWPLGLFSKLPLGVGLTQIHETMPLRTTLIIVYLLYFVMCEEPPWIEIHCNSIWLGLVMYDFILHLEGLWPHCMILEAPWDGLCTLSFGLSQSHGHGCWLMCGLLSRHSS